MVRALSLAAYRVLSWRGAPMADGEMPRRPKGELLWLHVSKREQIAPLCDLCKRLLQQRPNVTFLFSVPNDISDANWDISCAIRVVLPPDHPHAVRQFLQHWRPDLGLWSGERLEPNLLSEAAEQGIPLVLIGISGDAIRFRRHRWLPDLTRTTLECFDSILVTDDSAARMVRRAGVAPRKVSVAPALEVCPTPAPWPEGELIETNHALAGRPAWLAAWAQPKEFISILTAHRHALRYLHRLLLILHVDAPDELAPLRKRLEQMDLRCAHWDDGDEIEDSTQVILSATPEDLGLWYRVAPLTFIGSSLHPGAGGRDPMTAVALGSAVLYGANVQKYRATYARLNAAGAARSVRNADALGTGVVELLSPDTAAAMALAGWQVITETSQVTDQLIDLIQDRLETCEARHART